MLEMTEVERCPHWQSSGLSSLSCRRSNTPPSTTAPQLPSVPLPLTQPLLSLAPALPAHLQTALTHRNFQPHTDFAFLFRHPFHHYGSLFLLSPTSSTSTETLHRLPDRISTILRLPYLPAHLSDCNQNSPGKTASSSSIVADFHHG